MDFKIAMNNLSSSLSPCQTEVEPLPGYYVALRKTAADDVRAVDAQNIAAQQKTKTFAVRWTNPEDNAYECL